MVVESATSRAMSLKVNQLVDVAVETGHGLRLYPTRIEDQGVNWLSVALPRECPELAEGPPGLRVGVVAKSDRGVCILGAQVAYRNMAPVAALVLRLDGDAEWLQRRENVRLSETLDAVHALVTDEAGRKASVPVLNLSAGGMLVRSNRPLRPGAAVAIALRLPDAAETLELQAEVTRGGGTVSAKWFPHVVAVRFLDTEEWQKDRIVRFIFAAERRALATRRQEQASILPHNG